MRPKGNSNTISPGLRPSSAVSTMCTQRRPAVVSGCSLASLNIDTASYLLAAGPVRSIPEMVNPVTLHRDGIKGLDRAWGKPAQQTTGQIDLRGDVRELTTSNCTR